MGRAAFWFRSCKPQKHSGMGMKNLSSSTHSCAGQKPRMKSKCSTWKGSPLLLPMAASSHMPASLPWAWIRHLGVGVQRMAVVWGAGKLAEIHFEIGALRALEILGTFQKGETVNQGEWLEALYTLEKASQFNMLVEGLAKRVVLTYWVLSRSKRHHNLSQETSQCAWHAGSWADGVPLHRHLWQEEKGFRYPVQGSQWASRGSLILWWAHTVAPVPEWAQVS